jgi:endonuclease/exonuclease/phosphatase family metal-dependent hydrolase
MGDFDLLCLQEVAVRFPSLPGSCGEDQVAQLSNLLPGFSLHFGAATDILDTDGKRSLFGNLIASRFPVLQVFRHLLPWPAEAGSSSMQRIALEAVVDTPAGMLRVVTTHLEFYSADQRAAQVQGLRDIHRAACAHSLVTRASGEGPFVAMPRPASAIMTGDFNCAPDSAEYQRMLAPFTDGTPTLHDAWRIAHDNTAHAPTVGVHESSFVNRATCFDFAFVTSDLAEKITVVQVEGTLQASDHQPLLVCWD